MPREALNAIDAELEALEKRLAELPSESESESASSSSSSKEKKRKSGGDQSTANASMDYAEIGEEGTE